MSEEFGFKVTELVQKQTIFGWYLNAGNAELTNLRLKLGDMKGLSGSGPSRDGC